MFFHFRDKIPRISFSMFREFSPTPTSPVTMHNRTIPRLEGFNKKRFP